MQAEDMFQSPKDSESLEQSQPAKEPAVTAAPHKPNADLVSQALPGNNALSYKEEKKLGSRQNRYGVDGDNGFGQAVSDQRAREGLLDSRQAKGAIEFTQPERSASREKSVKSPSETKSTKN